MEGAGKGGPTVMFLVLVFTKLYGLAEFDTKICYKKQSLMLPLTIFLSPQKTTFTNFSG